MEARFLLLLLLIKAVAGQLGFGIDSGRGGALGANMPQITKLDVQCAKDGMTVDLEFSAPFDGVVFSKGFYASPQCRYLPANSGILQYQFTIPINSCGTQVYNSSTNTREGQKVGSRMVFANTVVFQMEEIVQEAWDGARTIECDWINNIQKTINFKPYAVDMLDAVRLRFPGDNPIDCSMDIQLGEWPNSTPLDSVVKIGEILSVIIYAKDDSNSFDLAVRDCYAYSGPNYGSPAVARLALTDYNGCVLKEKLISPFNTLKQADQYGANIIAFAFINAFKFPDLVEVYLSCNVEICKNKCDNRCGLSLPTGSTREPGSEILPEFIVTQTPTTVYQPPTTTKPFREDSLLLGEAITTPPPTRPPTLPPTRRPPPVTRRPPPPTRRPPPPTRRPPPLPPTRRPPPPPIPRRPPTPPPTRRPPTLRPTPRPTRPPTKRPPPPPRPKRPPTLRPRPKPKPTPSVSTTTEWKASGPHAFHTFHYSKGDGRRNHLRGKRSYNTTNQEKAQLTKVFRVVSIQDLPEDFIDNLLRFRSVQNMPYQHPGVCVSSTHFVLMTSGLVLFLLIFVGVFVYVCAKKIHRKM